LMVACLAPACLANATSQALFIDLPAYNPDGANMRFKIIAFALAAMLALAFPTTMLYSVQYAISQLCVSLKSMIPVVAMMMLVLAGVIYAAGQILGAETRARANVWATACLTGALIAILIVVVAQPVLQMIYSDAGTIACEMA